MPRPTNHLAIVTCVVLCATMPAQSQTPTTLTWSGGASGAWNTTGTNWTPATTDPWDATNGGSNIAAFGGTATVTVADTIYANGINFTGATTVTGGTIALTGTDPTVTFSTLSTSPARLGSQLSGSGGLTIASSATGINSTNRMFVLEGSQSNTFGDLTIRNTNTTGTSAWQFHQLAKTGGASALSGNLFIEGGSSATNLCVVYLVTSSSLPTGATVNLASNNAFTRFVLNGYAAGGNTVEIGGLASAGTNPGNTYVSASWDGVALPTTTLTINNSTDYAFAGVVQNNVTTGNSPLAIVKSGAGTQTLSGGNSFSGGTTINGGTLRIGSNTGLGSGAVVVNANGTLTLNPGVVATNTITGTGTITVSGTGSSYGNVNTGVSGFGGTIRVDTSAFWTNITGNGSATAKWEVNGGGSNTLALYPNSSNATISLGELSGNGSLAGTATAGLTTWEVGALGTNSTYAGVIRNFTVAAPGGTAGLKKVGAGRLTLSNTNSYTGATSVNAGTLAVNGSIAASSGVSVASGATLGGSGFVSAVSGAGRIAPGNSAGILTAPSVDPTTGMGFAFEFGATGSPNYADATASVNDVFHLTGGTPLVSSLTSSNAIDVYFNVATLGSGDTFRGGAYLDANVDFLTQVQGATYSYYVLGDGNGPTNGYYTLAQFDPSLSITLATVNDPAAFSGGSQDGRVMEFQAVPEPATLALLVGGLLGGGTLARRRRAA